MLQDYAVLRRAFASPVLFLVISFGISVLNCLDTFLRLMLPHIASTASPVDASLKPVFFLIQAASLILFTRRLSRIHAPDASKASFIRLLDMHSILGVLTVLLYVDFQIAALAQLNHVYAVLQPLFYGVYLMSLSGTCFWFALQLHKASEGRRYSLALVSAGVAYLITVLDPALFWSQNYLHVALTGPVALVITYAPHVLMALASLLAVISLARQESVKRSGPPRWLVALLLMTAFSLPLVWDSYRDGLINFIVYDVVYWSLGYSGATWLSVSLYLMTVVAYGLLWRGLARRSDRSLSSSLLILGVASLPWTGVIPLKGGYSAIPGNLISLSAIIAGTFLSKNGGTTHGK